MSPLPQEEWGYDHNQVRVWEIGTRLLLRRGKDGYFPLGERAYFEEIEKKSGLSPEIIRNTRNRAGDTLETLLHKSGDTDIARRMANIESIGSDPLEVYIGQLKGFFMDKWTTAISEYIKAIRGMQNPNAHPISMKPLLHYLCGQYMRTKYKYGILELIERFLSLPWVELNMLDFNGEHIFDIFDTTEKINENYHMIEILEEAWADWRFSTVWKVSESADGSYLEIKNHTTEPVSESHAMMAIRAYTEQAWSDK